MVGFPMPKIMIKLLIYGIKFWKQGKDLNVLKPIPINNKTLTSIPFFSIPS
jgi:hypothetical protein